MKLLNEPFPRRYMRTINRDSPELWRHIKVLRESNKAQWPNYCYLPLEFYRNHIVENLGSYIGEGNIDVTARAHTFLAAWRLSQDVYKFDRELIKALFDQTLSGNIPCEALRRLPTWCAYIEFDHHIKTGINEGMDYVGFLALLDSYQGIETLRIMNFAKDGELDVYDIVLGDLTIEESIEIHVNKIKEFASRNGQTSSDDDDYYDIRSALVSRYVNILLYLCANNADMPTHVHPNVREQNKGRIDAPNEPRIWNVGVRVGASIRKYHNEQILCEFKGGSHSSPRPHVRKAHWHSFWIGKRNGERMLILKWLPPIPVGVEQEDMPSVIHLVE